MEKQPEKKGVTMVLAILCLTISLGGREKVLSRKVGCRQHARASDRRVLQSRSELSRARIFLRVPWGCRWKCVCVDYVAIGCIRLQKTPARCGDDQRARCKTLAWCAD